MKKFMVLILLLGVSGAFGHGALARQTGCDITVSFGSYAMGIDHEAKEKIAAYVEKTKAITSHKVTPWGREGEKNLCLQVKPENMDKVYLDIKAMIPKESKKAWTEIRAKGKPNFRTQWPKGNEK